MLAQLLSDAASSYVLRNARRGPEQQLPPVAFMVVDVDQAPRTFHELFKFQTVPHLIFFPVRAHELCIACLPRAFAKRSEQPRGWTDSLHPRATWIIIS
jgi:hypothetical protein